MAGLTLITAPLEAPVSLPTAKLHLRVDFADEDVLITGLIDAAADYVRRILGQVMVTQEWRQDFDALEQEMFISLSPVQSITSVAWQSTDGTWSVIAIENYALKRDEHGRPYVRLVNAYDIPTDLYEIDAIQITFSAGYGLEADVPASLKAAILQMVAHWYANRETVGPNGLGEVPLTAWALLWPHMRMLV